jgi:hypothetical protein
MNMLNEESIHSKLLLNLPIHIDGIGNFHAPLLTEIIEDEEYYHMALNIIFFDKKDLEESTDDNLTNFEILLNAIKQDETVRKLFFYGLNLHLDTLPTVMLDGTIYFDKHNYESILTEGKFEYIKKLIKIANFIYEQKVDEYKPGNERAKKFLEKLKKNKKEINKLKKPKINLRSIISSVILKGNMFNSINQLTIYQLYDCFYRLKTIDQYNFTMLGVYTGNVDVSKIKLPDIDWANIVELKENE